MDVSVAKTAYTTERETTESPAMTVNTRVGRIYNIVPMARIFHRHEAHESDLSAQRDSGCVRCIMLIKTVNEENSHQFD